MSANPALIQRIIDLEIRVRHFEAAAKKTDQLKTSFNNASAAAGKFKNVMDSLAKSAIRITGIGFGAAGISSALGFMKDYSKEMILVTAQMNKHGVTVKQIEKDYFNFGRQIGQTRMEFMKMARAIERNAIVPQLSKYEGLLKNIHTITGANVEAQQEYLNVMLEFLDKAPLSYELLRKNVDEMTEGEKKYALETAKTMHILGDLSRSQYRMYQDILSANSNLTDEQKKAAEGFKAWEVHLQEFKLMLGSEVMPIVSKFIKWFTDNRPIVANFVKTLGSMMQSFVTYLSRGLPYLGMFVKLLVAGSVAAKGMALGGTIGTMIGGPGLGTVIGGLAGGAIAGGAAYWGMGKIGKGMASAGDIEMKGVAEIQTEALARLKEQQSKYDDELDLHMAIVKQVVEATSKLKQETVGLFEAQAKYMGLFTGPDKEAFTKLHQISIAANKAQIQALREQQKFLSGQYSTEADPAKRAVMLAEIADKEKQIANLKSEQLQYALKITEMYKPTLNYLDAEINKYKAVVSLADEFGVGVGASVEMRERALSAMEQSIQMLQQQLADTKALLANEKDNILLKTQVAELETQILNKQIEQANMAKKLREGWVSAISAMNTGAGRFTKLVMSQSQNLGQALRLGMTVTSVSGALQGGYTRGARWSTSSIGALAPEIGGVYGGAAAYQTSVAEDARARGIQGVMRTRFGESLGNIGGIFGSYPGGGSQAGQALLSGTGAARWYPGAMLGGQPGSGITAFGGPGGGPGGKTEPLDKQMWSGKGGEALSYLQDIANGINLLVGGGGIPGAVIPEGGIVPAGTVSTSTSAAGRSRPRRRSARDINIMMRNYDKAQREKIGPIPGMDLVDPNLKWSDITQKQGGIETEGLGEAAWRGVANRFHKWIVNPVNKVIDTPGKVTRSFGHWLGTEGSEPPMMAFGGIVPGRRGSIQPIIAHGGETVLPTHKSGSGLGVIISNLNVRVNFDNLDTIKHIIAQRVIEQLSSNSPISTLASFGESSGGIESGSRLLFQ